MKRAFVLAVLAVATAIGSMSFSSDAEARGWRGGHRFHGGFHGGYRHRGFGFAPVYPVYSGYCRWYRSPYGLVKRCSY